jgi:cell division protein FtsA
MENKNLIIALDVGTTKVCTAIAKPLEKNFEVIGVGSYPSFGLKKGAVVNIEKTISSIQHSLSQAKLMAGVNEIENVYVGIAGNHIYCFNSSGVIPVKGKEITAQDVERVLDAAKAVLIPSDREVLHVIAQEYRVDNTSGIKDPIGMCGSRLEVNVHIVTGKTTLIHNLVKCVEQAGLKPDKIILQPIASSLSVLSSEERELGVILLDIGGGTTDLAVWKDGSLVHSQIIPLGGSHFTNDLAYALKITHNEAEKIKVQNGSVIKDATQLKTSISTQGLTGTKPKEVELSMVSEVLEARAIELFTVVKQILKDNDLNRLITGGIVITGGGALIKGLPELAEFFFDRPVKLGYPQALGGMTSVMQAPKFATVLGLLIDARSAVTIIAKNNSNEDDFTRPNRPVKWSESIKNILKEVF